MAFTNTATAVAGPSKTTALPAKPQLKLVVPSLGPVKPTKKRTLSSMLMPLPRSDYDQHVARMQLVDCIYDMADNDHEEDQMIMWQDNPVFEDDTPATPANMTKTADADDKNATTAPRADSAISVGSGVSGVLGAALNWAPWGPRPWSATMEDWARRFKEQERVNREIMGLPAREPETEGLGWGKPWKVMKRFGL